MAAESRNRCVRPVHVVIGVLWMGVLAGGAVLQTHFRFQERDMDIQARRAQETLASLRDERRDLEATVERIRSSDNVRERALRLGLEPAPPASVRRMNVDQELWAKYGQAQSRTQLAAATGDNSFAKPAFLWSQALAKGQAAVAQNGKQTTNP